MNRPGGRRQSPAARRGEPGRKRRLRLLLALDRVHQLAVSERLLRSLPRSATEQAVRHEQQPEHHVPRRDRHPHQVPMIGRITNATTSGAFLAPVISLNWHLPSPLAPSLRSSSGGVDDHVLRAQPLLLQVSSRGWPPRGRHRLAGPDIGGPSGAASSRTAGTFASSRVAGS